MRLKVLMPILGVAALAAALIPTLGQAAGDVTKLIAKPMDGAQEVPGPGDDDAKGNAKLKLKPDDDELCFVIKWSNIEDPIGGHIQKGAEGAEGDVVVTLFDKKQKESPIKDCVDVSDEDVSPNGTKILKQLEAKPEKFYVNVEDKEFEDGAMRGQLEVVDTSK